MASTYTGLGTELMTTGENAGNWGTKTNVNLQIIEQLAGGYTEKAVTSTPTTLSVSDGSAGAELAHRIIKFTGTISENTVVTIPLDVQQMYVLVNGTSGSYTVQFKYATGSGSSVTFSATDKGTKIVYATADDGTNPNIVDTGIASHQINNTITVGVDDTGYDVKFFGATASAYMLWDESADDLVLAGAAGIDLAGDIDVDGTTNLDVVDIDGAVQIDGTVTVGVDGTGLDVKFFSASAGAYMHWDESADLLDIRGATAAGAGLLRLTTGELTVVDGNKLGRIDFQAPLESDGTDAILVAASIWAEADDTFAAGVNNTDLVFALGKSEAAAEKFRFTADNEIGIAGANYGTDGQVLTSGGAGAAVAWEDASGGAALTGSTNNTVVTVTGSDTIQGEANFTYDSTDAALTSGTSTKPIFSLTNTNTDANGSILKFIKDAGEAGAASDIPGLISFYCDDAGQAQTEFARIQSKVIDATAGGEEGSLEFHVAEYDGTLTKGMSITGLNSDGNIDVDISTHDDGTSGLKLGGTLVTSSATELNLMDGGTTAGTTAVASGDGIVTNDGGTMRQTTTATFDTYLSASTKTLTNKTLTAPKFADAGYIADANGNELVILQTTSSAVNQFDIANAAADNDPTITATGGDADVGLGLVAKGSGVVQITTTMNPTISSTGKALVLGF